jgi:hypothetical protein
MSWTMAAGSGYAREVSMRLDVRRLGVNIFIAILLLVVCYHGFLQRNNWPFTAWSMYSDPGPKKRESIEYRLLYPDGNEVPANLEECVPPIVRDVTYHMVGMWTSRGTETLRAGLRRMMEDGGGALERNGIMPLELRSYRRVRSFEQIRRRIPQEEVPATPVMRVDLTGLVPASSRK